ncbi:uncharacterized protein VTP21DRAFT_260 [Calcarisporiella thermophila]|uniref:uncharacterized protein n=1 Tax=Calcarisporiella thermophila TaxID=911321 RepID=UPI0037437351
MQKMATIAQASPAIATSVSQERTTLPTIFVLPSATDASKMTRVFNSTSASIPSTLLPLQTLIPASTATMLRSSPKANININLPQEEIGSTSNIVDKLKGRNMTIPVSVNAGKKGPKQKIKKGEKTNAAFLNQTLIQVPTVKTIEPSPIAKVDVDIPQKVENLTSKFVDKVKGTNLTKSIIINAGKRKPELKQKKGQKTSITLPLQAVLQVPTASMLQSSPEVKIDAGIPHEADGLASKVVSKAKSSNLTESVTANARKHEQEQKKKKGQKAGTVLPLQSLIRAPTSSIMQATPVIPVNLKLPQKVDDLTNKIVDKVKISNNTKSISIHTEKHQVEQKIKKEQKKKPKKPLTKEAARYQGDGTFYTVEGSSLACGGMYRDRDLVAALNVPQFQEKKWREGSSKRAGRENGRKLGAIGMRRKGRYNTQKQKKRGRRIQHVRRGRKVEREDSRKQAKCGRQALVEGPKGKVRVRIVDLCLSCVNQGDLDLSPAAFSRIAHSLNDGRVPIRWQWL